ncbi:MAG: DUF4230 domain-containing protein [Leptolyngbyaceae cyanobacterium CRU_2_3]|nr:DUF4230 domain-containing protein [Leptolyngbyaceae cyanobacterium CRU_2_3]
MTKPTSPQSYLNRSVFRKRNDIKRDGHESSRLLRIQDLIRNLSLVATSSAVLIALFLLTGVWRSGTSFFSDLSTLFNQPQPEPKVDLRAMVVQQVRNASELTTAVYAMETVVPASRDRTLGGYVVGTTTLLYIAYGEVRAGVDLSTLQDTNVQVTSNSITLRLPPPQILDSKIDVNRSKVYNYDRGFMGLGPDVAPELQELAQRETLQKIVESACTGGILQQANDRAKLAISQLLATTNHSHIQVLVEDQAPSTCAVASPSPIHPGSSNPGHSSPFTPLPTLELPAQPSLMEPGLPQPPA